jgi:hypothetical protein
MQSARGASGTDPQAGPLASPDGSPAVVYEPEVGLTHRLINDLGQQVDDWAFVERTSRYCLLPQPSTEHTATVVNIASLGAFMHVSPQLPRTLTKAMAQHALIAPHHAGGCSSPTRRGCRVRTTPDPLVPADHHRPPADRQVPHRRRALVLSSQPDVSPRLLHPASVLLRRARLPPFMRIAGRFDHGRRQGLPNRSELL